jgi:hypothetical protein
MARYLILGAGRFGRLALTRLAGQDRAAAFLVVDHDPEALAAAQELGVKGVKWVQAEAGGFLAGHLDDDAPWDWLIPMAPVHLAWVALRPGPLSEAAWETLPVPESVGRGLPLVMRGGHGELYLSRAAHLCPDDCAEPDSLCPVSGDSREVPLYEELAAMELPGFAIKVIPSRQLAPGVGGYPPRRLARLALEVAGLTGNLLVATACRCHGVVQALRRRREGGSGF